MDPQALQELAQQLVRIPSLSGSEHGIADFCTDWFAERGLQAERLEQTLVLRVPGGPGPRLLLNTHYDTVPAGDRWENDPWDVVWEAGRLTGLGANDAKGCVAAMMMATVQLAQQGELQGELILSLHQEEETNNRGMELVRDHIGPVDLAITGEPTSCEVIRSQSGLAVFVLTWEGKACHAAHISRVEHTNAMLVAAAELAQWKAPFLLPGEHELLGPSTLSPTVMNSGARHNLIPDAAEVVFDARLAPPHDADECVRILAQAFPKAHIRVRSKRLGAKDTAADHSLVKEALQVLGLEAAIGSNTLSDMALLPGVPAIKCGPGDTVRSHTAGEFITAEELQRGAEFYAQVIPRVLRALQQQPVQ
jgi:acetylornithine deacetylase